MSVSPHFEKLISSIFRSRLSLVLQELSCWSQKWLSRVEIGLCFSSWPNSLALDWFAHVHDRSTIHGVVLALTNALESLRCLKCAWLARDAFDRDKRPCCLALIRGRRSSNAIDATILESTVCESSILSIVPSIIVISATVVSWEATILVVSAILISTILIATIEVSAVLISSILIPSVSVPTVGVSTIWVATIWVSAVCVASIREWRPWSHDATWRRDPRSAGSWWAETFSTTAYTLAINALALRTIAAACEASN